MIKVFFFFCSFFSFSFGKTFDDDIFPSTVTTQWLGRHLFAQKPIFTNITILHFSLQNCSDFDREHIPLALCFDGNRAASKRIPYPSTMPTPEEFSRHVGKVLGINATTHVIIYDSDVEHAGLKLAPRGWFLFRVYGHEAVSVLEGGLAKWKFEGFPVTDKPHPLKIRPNEFGTKFRPELILPFEIIQNNLMVKTYQLIDARRSELFDGLPFDSGFKKCSGHIPGAKNIPLTEFFDPLTLEMHDPFRLRNLFELKGIDVDKPFASYCSSGMQASAVALAAYKINREIPIYDGSMSEWCARNGIMEGTRPTPTARFRNFDETSPGNSTWYKIHHLVMNMYHAVMRSLLNWNQ